VSSVPIPSSRDKETVLTILCPPCPYISPGFTRVCSVFQCYPPYLSSLLDLRILRTCQVYLTTVSSRCASCSRILQTLLHQVRIAPASSKCACRSLVHVSSKSTSLTQVHLPSPSSPLCPECCLSPLSPLLASGGNKKKMKFSFRGPLCEAHSAFSSSLAVGKPMLYQVHGVQNVTAPGFIPVMWRDVGGQCKPDYVARRLLLVEIVRHAP
jgi:hypothetical protein